MNPLLLTDARSVHVATLGCKLNQYESEAMLTQFRMGGYGITDDPAEADVCVVNTCAVTAAAERKGRSLVRSLRRRNPACILVAAGCMAEQSANTLSEIGADAVIGNAEKEHILDYLPAHSEKPRDAVIHVGETSRATTIADGIKVDGLLGRTRAFLKVQDGCSQKCTYCVIPRLRGVGRSLGIEAVVERAERLADRGFREIVITGVALGTYGFDLGLRDGLIRLVRALDRVKCLPRIRLGSIEPWAITEEFIRVVAGSERICPHLHVSVQSGDDQILRRMNRWYSAAQVECALNLAFRLRSDWGVGVDVIVGFPGEAQEHFENTRQLLARLPLSYLHVFPFSPRPGTPASRLEQTIAQREMKQRVAVLKQLDSSLRLRFRQATIGRVYPVLFESSASGSMQAGHAPNYLDVYVRTHEPLAGTIAMTRITDLHPHGVVGQLEKRD